MFGGWLNLRTLLLFRSMDSYQTHVEVLGKETYEWRRRQIRRLRKLRHANPSVYPMLTIMSPMNGSIGLPNRYSQDHETKQLLEQHDARKSPKVASRNQYASKQEAPKDPESGIPQLHIPSPTPQKSQDPHTGTIGGER